MPTGGGPSRRWLVPSPVVARVAGLPVSSLSGLRSERSFDHAQRVLDARAELASEAAALGDGLYAVIGRLGDETLRPALVGLRRALHRGRPPGAREWNPGLAAALPAELAAGIAGWLRRAERCREAAAELPAVLAAESDERRSRLRETVRDPGFRHALARAAPTLLDIVEDWSAGGRLPERRRLTRLAKYVSRAAAKTSPYSTFTVSGFAVWAGDGPPVRWSPRAEPLTALQLDGLLVRSVHNTLAGDPALRPAAAVRVNPSAAEVAGHLTFVGRLPGEPLVAVPATPALLECLRLVDSGAAATYGELRAALAALAAPGAADTDRADAFLSPLVEAGLFEVSPPVADHAADPLGELAAWLERVAPDDGAAGVPALLGRVRAEVVRAVPVGDIEARHGRERELRRAVGDLTRRLEIPVAAEELAARLVHETGVAPGPLAACAFPAWAPALDDLDLACRWLTVFAPKLPLQLVLGTWFRERYGPGGRPSLGAFYRAVEELAQAPADGISDAAADARRLYLAPQADVPPPLDASRSARLRELHRLRVAARELAAGDGGDVVRVAPAAVAGQLAGWPEWILPQPWTACYVQPRPAGDGLSLVLNMVQGGPARGRSRLRHLAELAGAAVPPEDPALDLPGGPEPVDPSGEPAVLAELGGLMGNTLNVRAPVLPYEIDYPFTVSGRPPERRIPLRDLVVELDPALDRVRLRSLTLDRVVVPLHLGMLVEFALPPAAAFLERVFSPTYAIHPSMPPLLPPTDQEPLAGLVTRPRVEIGRVVVQRRRWALPVAELAVRRAGEPDAEYYLRLLGWLRESGVPVRCFMRAWGGERRTKARKPIYVDFASWLLVGVFEQMVAGSAYVLFEEALPAPDEAAGAGGADRVAEFLVELRADDRRGGAGQVAAAAARAGGDA